MTEEKDEYEKEIEELVDEAKRFRNCISIGRRDGWEGYTISHWMAEFAVTKVCDERQRILELLKELDKGIRNDIEETGREVPYFVSGRIEDLKQKLQEGENND